MIVLQEVLSQWSSCENTLKNWIHETCVSNVSKSNRAITISFRFCWLICIQCWNSTRLLRFYFLTLFVIFLIFIIPLESSRPSIVIAKTGWLVRITRPDLRTSNRSTRNFALLWNTCSDWDLEMKKINQRIYKRYLHRCFGICLILLCRTHYSLHY